MVKVEAECDSRRGQTLARDQFARMETGITVLIPFRIASDSRTCVSETIDRCKPDAHFNGPPKSVAIEIGAGLIRLIRE